MMRLLEINIRRMFRSNKSQLEIFGILIVMMLLFMGMFFMMTTGSTKRTNAKDSYVAHQVSANVLNSLLATKVVCTNDYNLSMTELLQNCAKENDIYCDKTTRLGQTQDRLLSACEFSNLTLDYILNMTLDKWKISYVLTMLKDSESYTNPQFGKIQFINPKTTIKNGKEVVGCKKSYGGTSKMFPVPLYPGTLWIELFICT